ncbi:MAG: methylmalonyl-CoA epimerase [Thaumarchaeota archaeon]|nr:methylmalonyl-CoA epimerase [Nitrososphaerota archaeon]
MKFDHVAVAVKSIDETLAIYQRMGDFEVRRTEVAGQKVKIAILKAGSVSLELLEPLSDESSVAKFLREKGEGLHHVAYSVEDIEASMKELAAKGFRFLYEKPADGKFGSKINFMHPRDSGHVLVELTQNSADE